MNNYSETFDWIVVGGGISGVSIAEILCREGKSVLLVEKNSQLVSETSKVFHEWMHSGALYSLVPDNLLTLRYLLGATDDLFEFYNSFSRMNLTPTESGVKVANYGWFNRDQIEYRYRINKLNPIWMSLVSRSINIIDLLSNHDWLRRRAGSEYGRSNIRMSHWYNFITRQIKSQSKFYLKQSPDLTMNSRVLISDLLSAALHKGLTVVTGTEITTINDNGEFIEVEGQDVVYRANKVVICSPDLISEQLKVPIKTSYAPIAVVENVPEEEVSFVELDYNTKNCINLLIKDGNVGQAGGITVNHLNDVESYLEYIIREHKKRNPKIEVIDSYIGLKKELVQKGENRNYLYHINQNSSNIWSVVLGKFTLAFSMAPEFYRRVYHANPSTVVGDFIESEHNDLLSKTSWQEIMLKNR